MRWCFTRFRHESHGVLVDQNALVLHQVWGARALTARGRENLLKILEINRKSIEKPIQNR